MPAEPVVDLRSDTMTKPTPEMREAMKRAEVGNAAFGEDPTLNELERRCAEMLGKEAGMFVVSGTMGNQAALRVWTAKKLSPEVVCHERAHIYLNESAGLATVCGAQVRPLAGKRGLIPLEALERAVFGGWRLNPQTAVIALENTHNYENGAVLPLDYMRDAYALAQSKGVPLHLDGARVFNAAVKLGVPVRDVAQYADSVQFCFSKGLACPIGSMVVGSKAFIDEAMRVRQYLGGTLRQAGVIAAPALVAIDTMIDRLADDHSRCAKLAAGVKGLPLAVEEPDTNILVLDTTPSGKSAKEVAEAAAKDGVLFSIIGPRQMRAVTHNDIDDAGIARAIDALTAALEGVAPVEPAARRLEY